MCFQANFPSIENFLQRKGVCYKLFLPQFLISPTIIIAEYVYLLLYTRMATQTIFEQITNHSTQVEEYRYFHIAKGMPIIWVKIFEWKCTFVLPGSILFTNFYLYLATLLHIWQYFKHFSTAYEQFPVFFQYFKLYQTWNIVMQL